MSRSTEINELLRYNCENSNTLLQDALAFKQFKNTKGNLATVEHIDGLRNQLEELDGLIETFISLKESYTQAVINAKARKQERMEQERARQAYEMAVRQQQATELARYEAERLRLMTLNPNLSISQLPTKNFQSALPPVVQKNESDIFG